MSPQGSVPLLSREPGTRSKISAGAMSPVEPALTMAQNGKVYLNYLRKGDTFDTRRQGNQTSLRRRTCGIFESVSHVLPC